MNHHYYRLDLLRLWPLVELASSQGLTLTGRVPDHNARPARPITNVTSTFSQRLNQLIHPYFLVCL